MGKCPGDPYEIPDYKIYKVEDVPRLNEMQRRLEGQGLSDPWARNEVWRFKVAPKKRMIPVFFKGFVPGLIAALGTIFIEKIMLKSHEEHSEVKEACEER